MVQVLSWSSVLLLRTWHVREESQLWECPPLFVALRSCRVMWMLPLLFWFLASGLAALEWYIGGLVSTNVRCFDAFCCCCRTSSCSSRESKICRWLSILCSVQSCLWNWWHNSSSYLPLTQHVAPCQTTSHVKCGVNHRSYPLQLTHSISLLSTLFKLTTCMKTPIILGDGGQHTPLFRSSTCRGPHPLGHVLRLILWFLTHRVLKMCPM